MVELSCPSFGSSFHELVPVLASAYWPCPPLDVQAGEKGPKRWQMGAEMSCVAACRVEGPDPVSTDLVRLQCPTQRATSMKYIPLLTSAYP